MSIKTGPAARRGSRALCHGAYRTVLLTNRQYIFERAAEGERVLVAVNAEGEPFDAHFDAGAGRAVDLVTGRPHDFGGGSRLAPYSAAYWRVEKNAGVRRIRPDARAVLRFLKRTNA